MRCTGECCSTLYLPGTHAQIKQHADILINGWQIVNMIQPTGEQSSKGHHFTCKHWDQTTRLCTIYEDRPFMCRDYPYGQVCEHCGLEDGISNAERLALHRARPSDPPTIRRAQRPPPDHPRSMGVVCQGESHQATDQRSAEWVAV